MHNNSFWRSNSPSSPYRLGGFEKESLVKIYNKLEDIWFKPLYISPPLITVAQAVWISILINAQPSLLNRPVDVWLYAEYCSSIHLDRMHDTDVPDVTPTSNPVYAVDKGVFDYFLSNAWELASDYARYKRWVEQGTYEKINYVWDLQQVRLEPSKNLNNRKAWEYQFPMLYGSQIPNMDSLSPVYKVLRFLSLHCLEVLDYLDKQGAITNRYLHDITKARCETVGSWIDRALEAKGIEVVQFVQTDIEEGNNMFQLGTFVIYFRLMMSLSAEFFKSRISDTFLTKEDHEAYEEFIKHAGITLQHFTSVKDTYEKPS